MVITKELCYWPQFSIFCVYFCGLELQKNIKTYFGIFYKLPFYYAFLYFFKSNFKTLSFFKNSWRKCKNKNYCYMRQYLRANFIESHVCTSFLLSYFIDFNWWGGGRSMYPRWCYMMSSKKCRANKSVIPGKGQIHKWKVEAVEIEKQGVECYTLLFFSLSD